MFILLAVGCYKDKGNYDYKDVNNFEIVLSPESRNEDNTYTINQPATDTTHFTLKAEVKQTLESSKDNLFFEWISATTTNKGTVRDTIHAEEITLAFPPGKTTTYSVLCRVKDLTTDIEYFKNITIKTQVPFHDAWLLVHGAYGERKVGAIEWDVDGNMRWTADMLATMGQQAFPYLTSISYSLEGYNNWSEYKPERLLLTSAPDSSFSITPFDCKTITKWNHMRPTSLSNITISGKIFTSDVSPFMGFVDKNGHFFWGAGMGFFYEALGNEISEYRVDKFYINLGGHATLWDNENKRFMHYAINQAFRGAQDRMDDMNNAQITYLTVIPSEEMQDKEILYAGRGTKSAIYDEELSMFIAKDNTGTCYLYQFAYEGGKDDKAKGKEDDKEDDKDDDSNIGKVQRDTLHTIRFNERTLFAASDEFNEQLFYAQDNQMFCLNLNTEESINFHNVEGTIKQMAFRISNFAYQQEEKAHQNMKIIGLVVQKANGTDEFQEIYLDNAGDVTDVKTYALDGVSSIVDFAYTHSNRVFK